MTKLLYIPESRYLTFVGITEPSTEILERISLKVYPGLTNIKDIIPYVVALPKSCFFIIRNNLVGIELTIESLELIYD